MLDMKDYQYCILGQLYGTYCTGKSRLEPLCGDVGYNSPFSDLGIKSEWIAEIMNRLNVAPIKKVVKASKKVEVKPLNASKASCFVKEVAHSSLDGSTYQSSVTLMLYGKKFEMPISLEDGEFLLGKMLGS